MDGLLCGMVYLSIFLIKKYLRDVNVCIVVSVVVRMKRLVIIISVLILVVNLLIVNEKKMIESGKFKIK